MASTNPFTQLIFASQGTTWTPSSSSNSPSQSAAMSLAMALTGCKRSSPSNNTTRTPSHSSPVNASVTTRPGARRCGFPECAKTAKPGGFCISHGGGKKCSVDSCSTSVVSRGFCVAHGGGKRCQREACTKSAQTGGFCWIHGGGKKCGFEGCIKRAQSGGACISHGGGKRCRIEECNKVVQYDGLCVGHGGYRKCLSINCSKKALANSYCQSHGGNSQCSVDICIRKAVKGGLCSGHKGSVITPVQNNPMVLVGAYPPHRCIEPSKDKQQPSSYRPQSQRYHGASPLVKALLSYQAWQLKPQRTLEGLPGYAFAKDRPSLHMEPHHHSYDESGHVGCGGGLGSGRSFSGASPPVAMLPAIRTYSPLPTFGDLKSRPSLHLGKRSSPIAIGSPQPIKRLASLANIAKLSRPLTPLVGTAGLSPLLVTRHRLRLSNFSHDEVVVANSSTGSWLMRPCQVSNCERFAKANNHCLLHHSQSSQVFQASSGSRGQGVREGELLKR